MHRGYIKLWRKIEDTALWNEPRVFSKAEAWIDILLQVQWIDEEKEAFNGIVCGRGQSFKSLLTWAKRWGWNDKSKVSKFFKRLSEMGMIRTEKVGKLQRLTVLKYRDYQDTLQQSSNDDATMMQRLSNDDATIKQPDNKVIKEKGKKGKTEELFLETKVSCPEPDKSAPNRKQKKPKLTFNFETRKFENIEQSDIDFWSDSFPATDIIAEMKKAAAWLVANPTKRKSNYQKFLTNWFSRVQDSGGNKTKGETKKSPDRKNITIDENGNELKIMSDEHYDLVNMVVADDDPIWEMVGFKGN